MNISLPTLAILAFLIVSSVCIRAQRPAAAAKPASSETQLIEIEAKLARAWSKQDWQAVDRIIAPDWTTIGLDGLLLSKAEVDKAFRNGETRIKSVEMKEIKVRDFGELALVTGITTVVGETPQGAVHVGPYRFTDVFIRRDGRWQAVSSQATMLQKNTSATEQPPEPPKP